jgi:hypothetical protein
LQDIVFYALDNALLPVDASGVYFVLTASDVTVCPRASNKLMRTVQMG